MVKNCIFSDARDDAINFHGTYLQVVERLPDRQMKVRFMHPQNFGFIAFNPGDEIEFVHSDSLAIYGATRVINAPNSSVHRNIRIENNEFVLRGPTAVQVKSTSGLRVTGNTIRATKELDDAQTIQTSDCAEVVIENNGHKPVAE